MALKLFLRKADFAPSTLELLPEYLISSSIPTLVKSVLGVEPRSFGTVTVGTYHYIYHIIYSDQECFLKIPKFIEYKDTIFVEKYIYKRHELIGEKAQLRGFHKFRGAKGVRLRTRQKLSHE